MTTSHRFNKFVADKSVVVLGARQLELSVEIVGWLLVGVGDLSDDLLIVVDHVAAHNLHSADAGAASDVESEEHVLRNVELLVVRVERREDIH